MSAARKGWPALTKVDPPAQSLESEPGIRDRVGSTRALSTVAQQLQGPLLRYLSQRVGSREEAKEILQDAYVRLLAVKCPESIQSLDRYLWRCALNLMIDYGRQHRRQSGFVETLSREPEGFAPSAETSADTLEQLVLIDAIVHELPPKCYQAFVLRIVQSRHFDEVGREMHIGPRMAKVYVARTLSYIRARLAESESGRHGSTRTIERAASPARDMGRSESRVYDKAICRRGAWIEHNSHSDARIHHTHANTAGDLRVGAAPAPTLLPSEG